MIKMNPELLTGDRTIDEQHQELFYIGERIKKLTKVDNLIEIKQFYEKYLDLIIDHFTYEEMLMLESKYPADDFQQHRASHRILQEIYLVAYRPILTGDVTVTTVLELFESRFLMYLWEEDLKLAQFIRAAKASQSL